MKKLMQDIVDFHVKYGIEYDGPVRLLPENLEQFRVNFMSEEAQEYANGVNLAEKLDAMIDLMYVIAGTAHLHGFTPEDMQEAWDRVHDKNMRKVKGRSEEGRHSSDVVKPSDWTPPVFDDIIERGIHRR